MDRDNGLRDRNHYLELREVMTAIDDSSWRPAAKKWPWRNYLTSEEKMILAKADTAKAVWLSLNQNRAAIINRAIQRAKYDRTPGALSPREKRRRRAMSAHTEGE